MGIFDRVKKEKILSDLREQYEETEQVIKVIPETIKEEKWIWVEGYKGMTKDMTCKNNFQFEIGKTYTYDGDVELCSSGFHFCTKLDEVFSYYGLNLDLKHMYFKVKGLVPEEMFNNIGKYIPHSSSYGMMLSGNVMDSKLSAKEIVVIEELTFEDLKEYRQQRYPFIETKAEYEFCCNNDYYNFARNKFINKMKDLGFSEPFSIVVANDLGGKMSLDFISRVKAYREENLSKDMLIYLIMSDINKK